MQVILDNPDQITYNVKVIDIPSLSGKLFSLITNFLFTRFGQSVAVPQLLRNAKLFLLSGEFIPEKPTMNPCVLCPQPSEEDHTRENRELIQRLLNGEEEDAPSMTFRFPSVRDYYTAYKEKRCTPVEVANKILEAIKETNRMVPPLRAIVDYNADVVKQMAQDSLNRWQAGEPLSVLDGVPVSIKAEFRTEPYPFRCGTMFQPIFADITPETHVVQNLKEAGAVIIGIANMQELGTGTLGSNPNRFNRTPRNPYNTGRFAGGSSSGSAVSVAAGLCPISLGADGGGSVRIPAALCGLVGVKPTHGLLESIGEMPISSSVSCPGPICGSALDAIIAMDVLSKNLRGNKTLSLHGIGATTLGGLKVGIYHEFFNHCDDNVRTVCQPSLQVLEELGTEIIDIKIPELEESATAHLITLLSEYANGLAGDVDKHFTLFNPETLLVLAGALQIQARDYLNAQKQRTRAITFFKHIFKEVDVIVTPTTACVAPEIDEGSLQYGKSMTVESGKLMRYLSIANFTGNPAVTFPIGLSSDGLPVGLHFIGKWYDESTLLNIAWALEKSNRYPATKPGVFCDILQTTTTL